jgi:hypothetical protein
MTERLNEPSAPCLSSGEGPCISADYVARDHTGLLRRQEHRGMQYRWVRSEQTSVL